MPGVMLLVVAIGSTGPVSGDGVSGKTSAASRAERRAYDGAPPVIGHENFNIECVSCHTEQGTDLEDVGFAPAMPHEWTEGLSAVSRCRQCHVFRVTTDELVANRFEGLRQDMRHGRRHHVLAPPVIPHKTFMRENCLACHSGPSAREEIRTSHPERVRCRQCHVSVEVRTEFDSVAGPQPAPAKAAP